ncbi:hypothetical protein HMPREF1534_03218 [Phocaeicola massiliensis B84634 = Timone 84634 = DSM 17679 = JCM 13223]|uniref:Uncharacterized protein n=1 Tax=Phocaeicola massiliensis B84634 = Timone 84634 = DSM 17679 = JCM 13223 TaxID=1121098 RepID=U6R972_9BACT|nr:hypothetical protein HMPREF1534_03218 [Phocaeicola massiliensis B84634 = Timone 84634 = DSM 17679 = JCM 13223]MDQ7676437.1 hypothetical protein [Phocaeicola massiliensis]
MAYEVIMPYHLHMPSYFLETFTEYPHETPIVPTNLHLFERHFNMNCFVTKFR